MRSGHLICKLSFWLLASILCLSLCGGPAHGEEHVYHTQFTTIHYNLPEQLDLFGGKLNADHVANSSNETLPHQKGTETNFDFGNSIDGLFKQVQHLLDMPLPNLRVHIRVYSARAKLSEAYGALLKVSSPETYAEWTLNSSRGPVAFYWKKTNTIHVQTDDLSIGVLAHEMAHAVIDHYFVIRPPIKISEMLCQYVDRQVSAE